MLTARIRRLRSDDRGVTLAEMLVAMGISTILGTVAMFFFIGAARTGSKTILTNQNTGDARVALDSWTSMLRVAGWLDAGAQTDRFEEITPTKIVFYANLDNRTTADQTIGAVTKVALLLRTTNVTTGEGNLVEMRFNSDNTTVKSVRQVAFNVQPTGGAGQAVFLPRNHAGGVVDTINTNGCRSGGTAKPGLCLQSPPAGAGMLDPGVSATSMTVSSGSLRGNSAVNVDTTLADIGSITVGFTARSSSGTASMDFSSTASVNSGFPS
jgi:prepilin-type N-terminal cleavage/methylation domain-containing protein